jgi:NADPH-dependent 2,4-dienoyl-CoA reductase/sulfur reductase-like enzyme
MAGMLQEREMEAAVVVVGGGPAGLAAATEVARRGMGEVVLLERDTAVGGIPRHCGHSPFGMREFHRILTGTAYAARLEAEALAAGVRILVRHSVLSCSDGLVTAATPDGLRTFRAQRIVLATGARETSRAGRLVSGDRPIGVINTGALQNYVHQQHLAPFRRPVIVGTELVSMSAILTCRTGGIRPVAIIEEGARPTVRFPFHLLPHLAGIPVLYGTRIVDINGRPRVEAVIVETGAARQEIACDGIIFTGRFTPESSLARLSGITIDAGSGGPSVDVYGRTSDPHVFAVGNLLRPIETAGWCWAEAKNIAAGVVADLKGELPSAEGRLSVETGPGIKLAVPQMLDHAGVPRPLSSLQLRLSAPAKGRLTVSDGTRDLWSRSIDSRPERRILIPLGDLAIGSSVNQLTISVTDQESRA